MDMILFQSSMFSIDGSSDNAANIYLFQVKNKNTRKRCEIC